MQSLLKTINCNPLSNKKLQPFIEQLTAILYKNNYVQFFIKQLTAILV